MNPFVASGSLASASSAQLQFLIELAGKSLALLAAFVVLMALWRRGAAAMRHWVWLTGLIGLLVLPVGQWVLPVWHAPTWAQPGHFVDHWVQNSTVTLPAPSASASVPLESGMKATDGPSLQTKTKMAPTGSTLQPAFDVGWGTLIFLVWVLGATVALIGAAWRAALLRQLGCGSRELADLDWKQLVREEKAKLGLKRQVELRESAGRTVPMTWGWWRPVVLLPQGAAGWEQERLRLVLCHELAHVKRWDCLTHGIARLAGAIYWFNPLVWVALRQLRWERERACDDLVLRTGARPSTYAGHLLAIARQFTAVPAVAALPLAQRSHLEQRLRAIVSVNHRPGRLRLAPALIVLGLVGSLVGGAAEYDPISTRPLTVKSKILRDGQPNDSGTFTRDYEHRRQPLANTSERYICECQVNSKAVRHNLLSVLGSKDDNLPTSELLLRYFVNHWQSRGDGHFSGRMRTHSVNVLAVAESDGFVKLTVRAARRDLGLIEKALQSLNRPNFRTGNASTGRVHGWSFYAADPKVARRVLKAKLDTIKLDRVEFPPPGARLSDVVRFLREQAKVMDPEHQGIRFVLDPWGIIVPTPISYIFGENDRPIQTHPTRPDQTRVAQMRIRLEPGLRNVTLREALNAIVRAAPTLMYQVQDYVVLIAPKLPEPKGLLNLVFHVDPTTVRSNLLSVLGCTQSNLSTSKLLFRYLAVAGINLHPQRVPRYLPEPIPNQPYNDLFQGLTFSLFPHRPGPLDNLPFYDKFSGNLILRGTWRDYSVIEKVLARLNHDAPPARVTSRPG